MLKIAIIVPENLIDVAKDAAAAVREEVMIFKGSMSEGIKLAKKLEKKEYDVIIARGGTEQLLLKSGLKIPTVPIAITAIDIFKTIEEAKKISKKIAVIPFDNMMPAIESYEEISGEKLEKYLVKNENEVEEKVREICKRGIGLVIGGGIIAKYSPQYNVKPIVIKSGKEALINTIREAKRIAIATRKQKENAEKFKVIIEHAHNGIISVNQDGFINIFNLTAQKLLNINEEQVLEKKVSDVIPELDIFNDFSTIKEESEIIRIINGNKLMFSIIPIMIRKQVIGNIISVEEIDRIQRMEEKIRREVVVAGHYAKYNFHDIIGSCSEITKVIQIAKEYAKVEATVLIEGETGTGKEVMAQSIHNYSKRALGPFVAVNCAALPESILESELFGYAPGAFTGAERKGKKGYFELAHKGTIFLDEISEMNNLVQGRMLRVLQEKQIVRLGDDKVIPIDIRVIAATNKNLRNLAIDGKFRKDLYFRLNVLKIVLPPLRKRADDIPKFLKIFMQHFDSIYEKTNTVIEDEAIKYLCEYNWPGNIRELKNVVERLVITTKQNIISLKDIKNIEDNLLKEDHFSCNKVIENHEKINRHVKLVDKEKSAIEEALRESYGNMINTAKKLGISRTTLWRKIKKYNINVSR